MKRILALLLCVGVLWVAIGTPLAEARWTHLRSISLNLSRSNNTVTSTVSVMGHAGTTRILASFVLERLVDGQYRLVTAWTDSTNSSALINTRQTSNCPAGTYRLRVTVTVTRDGSSETVSDSIVRNL